MTYRTKEQLTADELQVLEVLMKENEKIVSKYGEKYRQTEQRQIEYLQIAGWNSLEEMRRSELIGLISDTFKDLWGYRPRWNYPSMSTEELEQSAAQLTQRAQEEFEAYQREQEEQDRMAVK